MPDIRRARCQVCGALRADGVAISWTGLCRTCAIQAVADNLEALDTKQGYNYRRYIRGLAKYIAAAELDEEPLSAQTGGHGSR